MSLALQKDKSLSSWLFNIERVPWFGKIVIDQLSLPTELGWAHPATQPYPKGVDQKWLPWRLQAQHHFSLPPRWNHFSSPHPLIPPHHDEECKLWSQATWIQNLLLPFLDKELWRKHLTFLRLNFLTYKVEILIHLLHKGSCSQLEAILPPGDIWECLETFFDAHDGW